MSHRKAYQPTPEPHRIPGYTGHLSHLRDQIGSRYSIATHRAIEHSTTDDERPLTLPETLHSCENRGELKRVACVGTKSKVTECNTDSAANSILQRATEFLKSSLFDKSCCNKYVAPKEKYCGSEHLKREPQSFHPCMYSGSARSYKPCIQSCELVLSKQPPITAPSPLLYQRLDELCNKDICRSKYPCLDDPNFVKNSECPRCPTTMPSRYSTTPHFRTSKFPGKYSYSGYPSGKESTDMFQPQVVPMYSTAGPPIYLRHEGLPPKYGGHVPGKDFSYGETFGRATTDAKQCLVEDYS